jgi:hypothetical protein
MQAAKRRVKRIAPKKRFSLSRALGLKKSEPVIVVHVPHRDARASEAGGRTSTSSGGRTSTSKAAAPAPATVEEEDDEEDD